MTYKIYERIQDRYYFFHLGKDFDNTHQDSCWSSSWLYGAACILGNVWPIVYNELHSNYLNDPMAHCEQYGKNFDLYCSGPERINSHPLYPNHFSRDQLSSFLWLCAAVYKYQPHLIGIYKPILQEIVNLYRKQGYLNGWNNDIRERSELYPNIAYVLKVVANAYGIKKLFNCFDYRRYTVKEKAFQTALAIQAKNYELKIYNHNYFAPFNAIAQLSACHMLGKSTWLRKHFSYYAKSDWGVAYKIIRGYKYEQSEIDFYKMVTAPKIDIISQWGPGHKERRGGPYQTFDYFVLKALSLIW